ncbi:fluoride efflux transporter CrcB [Bacillus sp. AK031]
MAYLLVGLGGAVGSVCRYLMGNALLHLNPPSFPYGTLVANLAGCFILGLLTESFVKHNISPALSSAVGTGIVGSFTTFSAFSVETIGLVKDHHYALAFLYLLLSGIGGLVFAWMGMAVYERKGDHG